MGKVQRFISLLFHINRSIHSTNTIISKFYRKNPNIHCQVIVEVKVQVGIMGPTLHHTHMPFVLCQAALPLLRYSFLKVWAWQSEFKVMGGQGSRSQWVKQHTAFSKLDLEIQVQGHTLRSYTCNGSNFPSTHTAFVIYVESPFPIPRYDNVKIWPWKSKTNVMVEVKGRGHMISPALIRWISVLLHVNRSNHSYRYISISGWFQETVIISFSHELNIYMITNSTQYHIDLPIVFKLPAHLNYSPFS